MGRRHPQASRIHNEDHDRPPRPGERESRRPGGHLRGCCRPGRSGDRSGGRGDGHPGHRRPGRHDPLRERRR